MEDNNILQVKNVSRTYGSGTGKVEALKDCSFDIEKGQFVAIIGKSGSGKSTLLRILGTIDRPNDKGKNKPQILIEGQDILKLSDSKLSTFRRQRIGFVFQDYNLFPEFTAYENIIMPLHIDGRKADENQVNKMMEQLGIIHCKNKFPQEMSGGEQQRTSIARALVTHPAIIFADEPTGNLDGENSTQVACILKDCSKLYDQTIIMVTHDHQMADYADRIITIENGVVG
ncbi:MAG: ABC transporter ATP-binding protein [Lachnospiraceae bacterium]